MHLSRFWEKTPNPFRARERLVFNPDQENCNSLRITTISLAKPGNLNNSSVSQQGYVLVQERPMSKIKFYRYSRLSVGEGPAGTMCIKRALTIGRSAFTVSPQVLQLNPPHSTMIFSMSILSNMPYALIAHSKFGQQHPNTPKGHRLYPSKLF
jgi:hypothetical protein